MTPAAYKYWPQYARDTFDERVAMMIDGNNVPNDVPVPMEIARQAMKEAQDRIDEDKTL